MTSRLKEFRVEGLFGLYSHVIPLNMRERITAVIGPNGRGKTVCLKLIEALFARNYGYFISIPFHRAEYHFEGGKVVSVEVSQQSPSPIETRDGLPRPPSKIENRSIKLTLQIRGRLAKQWVPVQMDPHSRELRELSRKLPFLEQSGPDEWIDKRDGEKRTLQEVITRHRRQLPERLIEQLRQLSTEPEMFLKLISLIDCHLIETQRLLVLRTSDSIMPEDDFRSYGYSSGRGVDESRLAITQKAEKLKKILQDKLAEYATLSQSLDRTFPRRVIEDKSAVVLSEQELEDGLAVLDKKRSSLMAAGILDKKHERERVPFVKELRPGVAKVLEIYVHDTTLKLNVFEKILAQINALKELTESRFIDKTLEIDRANGFKILSKTGAEVPLDRLSSGEQHQLILLFDLLFEVNENSLILIDEPELSLHIYWQRTFIDSLKKIISLNAFDLIVATHSPPLVAHHYDLTVELGPVDDLPLFPEDDQP